ncbi:MAG: hypothetical protein JO261_09400 [Alphaproteobacteria bacterium]|nr:hypothetical protein [Alphaproteobacteria bacterium]MBV9693906.1 hypothetical protein [Alphaproteobacteria bacterium]
MTTIHAASLMMPRHGVAPNVKGLPVMKLDPNTQPSAGANLQGLPVMKVGPADGGKPAANANGLPVMKLGSPLNTSASANGLPVMQVEPENANSGPCANTNGLPIMQVDPGSKTKSGTVQSSTDGDGSFTKTTSTVDGHKTVATTVTYADGKTVTHERSVTLNPDGSKTITVTNGNGKTKTITESETKNTDGSVSIDKQVTKANGDVTNVSGTVMKVNGQTEKQLTLTNAKGQTETVDSTSSRTGNIVMHSRTGTGYDGHSIDKTSTWTTYA